MDQSRRLFTTESVTEGHPDKICDAISDSILDAMLEQDANARVAVETMVTTGQVHVAGEVKTTGYVEIPDIVRKRILTDQIRIDGRGLKDIRPLTAETGVIPRVHGSALFERGETQILGVTTLNMLGLEQKLDTLSPETTRRSSPSGHPASPR